MKEAITYPGDSIKLFVNTRFGYHIAIYNITADKDGKLSIRKVPVKVVRELNKKRKEDIQFSVHGKVRDKPYRGSYVW